MISLAIGVVIGFCVALHQPTRDKVLSTAKSVYALFSKPKE